MWGLFELAVVFGFAVLVVYVGLVLVAVILGD